MDTITKAVVAAAGVLVWESKVHTAQCIEVSCNVECIEVSVEEYIALRSTCMDLLEREYSGIHSVLTRQLQWVY